MLFFIFFQICLKSDHLINIIKHQFTEEKKYHEKIFEFKNVDGKYYKQISDVVKQRNNLKEVTFTKTSEVLKRSNESGHENL